MNKLVFTLTIFLIVLTSCKKDDPPATPKSLTAIENEMLGTWQHVKTIHFDGNGDTSLVVIPSCGNPYLEFKSSIATAAGIEGQYDLYYNQDCLNQDMGWTRPTAPQLKINGSVHSVIMVTPDSLVLDPSNSPNTRHFYTK